VARQFPSSPGMPFRRAWIPWSKSYNDVAHKHGPKLVQKCSHMTPPFRSAWYVVRSPWYVLRIACSRCSRRVHAAKIKNGHGEDPWPEKALIKKKTATGIEAHPWPSNSSLQTHLSITRRTSRRLIKPLVPTAALIRINGKQLWIIKSTPPCRISVPKDTMQKGIGQGIPGTAKARPPGDHYAGMNCAMPLKLVRKAG